MEARIIGLDELKEYLGVTNNASDEVLAELEPSAVAIVENWTGVRYPDTNAAIVENVRGYDTDTLYLQLNPSADPAQVLERANMGEAGTVITAAQSDGWVRLDSRLVRKTGVWRWMYWYEVTYAGGYVTDSEPADVRMVVKEIVGALYSSRGTAGLKSETIGPYSYTMSDDGGTNVEVFLQKLPRRVVFA